MTTNMQGYQYQAVRTSAGEMSINSSITSANAPVETRQRDYDTIQKEIFEQMDRSTKHLELLRKRLDRVMRSDRVMVDKSQMPPEKTHPVPLIADLIVIREFIGSIADELSRLHEGIEI